jgi:hypothetical protein
MHYKKNRKGYICGSFNKHGIKACSSHIIREQNLENIIISDIKFLLTSINNNSILDTLNLCLNKENNSKIKRLKSLESKISKLETRKSNALKKFIDDFINKDDYDNIVTLINSELYELLSEKNSLENTTKINLTSDINNGINHFKKIASNVHILTPYIINQLIDRIEVEKDGTPRIYYRFSKSSICLSDFINQTF